nr:MAG TPA: hypothetical protein [Caudoviricetes sp.]
MNLHTGARVTNCFGKRSEGLGVDSVPVREEEAARKGYLAESTLEKRPANGALRGRYYHCPTRRRTRPGKPSSDGNRLYEAVRTVVSRTAEQAGN